MRTALFAIAAAAALAACSGKKEPPPGPASGSAADPARAADPGSSAKPAPGSAPAPAPTSAAASGDFPEACGEYRQTVERLATCGDALPPPTRDNLRAMFDKQWSEWSKLPEQDRRTLAAICKSSSDSVKTAAAAACGW